MNSSIELFAGDYRATIGVLGAAPRSLTWRGRNLVQPFAEGQPPLSAGIVLAPWPNRVADGRFRFGGRSHELAITESERNTALHGLVGSRAWEVERQTSTTVVLGTTVSASPGWPWPLSLKATWTVSDESHPIRQGLSLMLEVRNDSAYECPLGVGWHPYLVAAGARLDDSWLGFDGEFSLDLDGIRNLPTGAQSSVDEVLPLSGDDGDATARPMAGRWLDHCFRLADPASGQGPFVTLATLLGPDGSGVELWGDRSFGWLQVFTADPARGQGFPGVGRALAVEPMTCPPNALVSGVDLVRLAPGQARVFCLGVAAVHRDAVMCP